MTLDEAIKHARDKANEQKCHSCKKCAEEHEQLASWLGELKAYREVKIIHCKDCKHWGTGVAGETENVKCCEYGKYMVGANGYCVYGEKECVE